MMATTDTTATPLPGPSLPARQATRITPAVIVLAIGFVSFLLISNAMGARVCEVVLPWTVSGEPLRLTISAALISFPFAYLFSSVLTEVYGYRISRVVIWSGLGANLVMLAFLWLMAMFPTDPAWAAQTGFTDEVQRRWFEAIAHMFLASVSACLVGEFANAATLARMKVAMHGRLASLRFTLGSALAAALDSIVFVVVAFAYVLDVDAMARMAGIEFVFKCALQWLVLPATLGLARWLKRTDGIDHYDVGTSLNPFGFRMRMAAPPPEPSVGDK
ncbi:VUT family protein [Pandoraea pulmonicola]|uniref:Conserved hypothetical integral membrane protein n=1 Tax=Pandoraea pulmonicola TaxID=93221 RepID=A0AAJ4Z8N6_PANPU|nr:VUT family protein [Pandoraea pulmonicola]SUA88828.1 conserved hypothetical integral membrane protein [Pandoraea pulmonicola]